jgi:hypothetical protein
VIDKEVVRECLAQLIVMRNLPHNAIKWSELRALLLSVNYYYEDTLIDSQSTISKVIFKSFLLEKVVLKQKLKTALSKIHLSRVLRKALLALLYLPDGHGSTCQAIELIKVLDKY